MTPALCFWIGLCGGLILGYWLPRLSSTYRLKRRLQARRGRR